MVELGDAEIEHVARIARRLLAAKLAANDRLQPVGAHQHVAPRLAPVGEQGDHAVRVLAIGAAARVEAQEVGYRREELRMQRGAGHSGDADSEPLVHLAYRPRPERLVAPRAPLHLADRDAHGAQLDLDPAQGEQRVVPEHHSAALLQGAGVRAALGQHDVGAARRKPIEPVIPPTPAPTTIARIAGHPPASDLASFVFVVLLNADGGIWDL